MREASLSVPTSSSVVDLLTAKGGRRDAVPPLVSLALLSGLWSLLGLPRRDLAATVSRDPSRLSSRCRTPGALRPSATGVGLSPVAPVGVAAPASGSGGNVRRKPLQLRIRDVCLQAVEYTLHRVVGGQTTVGQASDYEQRNGQRSLRSRFRQFRDSGTIYAFTDCLGTGLYFVAARLTRASAGQRASCCVHSLSLLAERAHDVERRDSLRREFERAVLESFCRELARTCFGDPCKHAFRDVSWQNLFQANGRIYCNALRARFMRDQRGSQNEACKQTKLSH